MPPPQSIPSPSTDVEPKPRMSQKVAVAIVFVGALFIAILDVTILNVALPSIGKQFGATSEEFGMIAVGFLVSQAVVIPASGWIGDRFGTKRVFLFALALFTVASVLCGAAQSLNQLVLFRVLQGIGGGMMMPIGMAMLFRVFPQEERVRVSRILIIPTAIAPASGPILGGLLVDSASWRWVFYINVPIGVAAFVFGLIFLEEHKHEAPGRFDIPGFLLAGGGFAALMYALSEGAGKGWDNPLIISTGIAGVVLLTAMVFYMLRASEPMLKLRLYKDKLFVANNLVSLFSGIGFMGVLYVFPLLCQQAFGWSALKTGLHTFPEAFGVMLGTQLASRIYPRIGPKRMMAAGLVGVAICSGLLSRLDAGTPTAAILAMLFFTGFCISNVWTPMQAAAFANITPADSGAASTLFNTQRQLSSALGIAIVGTVMTALGFFNTGPGGAPVPNLDAYHTGFMVAAGLALVGAAVALTVKDEDAAATMGKPKKPEPVTEVTGVEQTPAPAL